MNYDVPNSHDRDSITQGVKCDVSNCVYNQHSKYCNAGSIEVGPGYAKDKSETICATFENQPNR